MLSCRIQPLLVDPHSCREVLLTEELEVIHLKFWIQGILRHEGSDIRVYSLKVFSCFSLVPP